MDGENDTEDSGSQPSAMFAPQSQICAVHFEIKANWCIGGTCPAAVDGGGIGKENKVFSRLVESIAPVNILSIHEKLRIQ